LRRDKKAQSFLITGLIRYLAGNGAHIAARKALSFFILGGGLFPKRKI